MRRSAISPRPGVRRKGTDLVLGRLSIDRSVNGDDWPFCKPHSQSHRTLAQQILTTSSLLQECDALCFCFLHSKCEKPAKSFVNRKPLVEQRNLKLPSLEVRLPQGVSDGYKQGHRHSKG